MKQKNMLALALLCVVLFGFAVAITRKNTNDISKEQSDIDNGIETTVATEEAEQPAENTSQASIIESTPDSVMYEISGENSDNPAVVIMGAEIGEGEGEDFDENSNLPTDSQVPTAPKSEDTSNPESSIPSVGSINTGFDSTLTYEEYEAMTNEEKLLYYYSFADADAFFEWYNAAKAAYDAENESIIIGADGTVDLG